ncbi:TonB-dependent receptor [Flavisolibacter ginsenosidimutans]|uniref:TonB-dependent receptor n=1 Tax=Flavisolibacter ginsenosidimutans TaxID=661481 RepID=A0A5B8UGG7_9BACT|nr:TonB-dependent receptor [Flavisolibacter ginsenosidimutans]QEC55598.1 TonB-dependent receptor [Flavisolibacter ginsenosidimutans]
MKKIFTVSCLLFSILFVSAQMPGGGFNRGGANGGQMPTGRFYGKVIDPSNKGIEAASVTLVTNKMDTATKKMKEVIVSGMLTTKSGDFSLENIPLFGRYTLRISGIGFKTYEKPVAFDMPNRDAMSSGDMTAALGALDKDLGNIKVQVDEKLLSTVTVTASRPMMTLGIDRKIFNVDRNITSAGGTAVDIMRNVPSLNVDIDGNVTLRNTAPTIFVDGRPTTLTLDQIPADAIESVEVITNPSAKFDASGGTAGILNIVMKKNRRVGYSGNLRANLDSRAKFGLGGDLNVRQDKINLFGSGMFMQRKSNSTGYTDRYTSLPGTSHSFQQDHNTGGGQFGFVRGGFDYFMDIRNTFTVSGSYVHGKMSPENRSDIRIDSFAKNRAGLDSTTYTEYQQRLSNSTFEFRNKGAQLSYKHNFPQTGHELTADATYNKSNNENNGLITTDYFNAAMQPFRNRYNQTQYGAGTNENLTVQTDYSNPITTNSKLEAGARVQIRNVNSENTIQIAGKNNSTIYNSTDKVYAAYTTFSNRIKNFGYQAGLRVESSNYEGVLPTKGNETFNIKFPISLFPSLFLSQKLNESDELQFNYSRRINRPGFFQLFPFTDYSDSLNISRGNPNLKPEFTNSLELSYSKTFKNRDNFLASLYFKHTNNLITRIQALEADTVLKKTIPVNTFQNANNSYVTGLELTSRNKVTKFWDLTTNFNLFTAKIDLTDQPDPDQIVSYFFKVNNSFKLPKNFSLQLSGDYQSKIISSPGGRGTGGGGGGFMGGGGGGGFFGGSQSAAQGFIRPNYGVDAAIRFEFLKNKVASLSLNVNDIFRTRVFDQHTETSFFVQDAQRRRDPQVFRLNFNYRFGKFDVSLFKRKNTKADNNVDMNGGNPNF